MALSVQQGHIGSATALNPTKARVTLYARVKVGRDPAGQKQENRVRAHQSFGAVLEAFLKLLLHFKLFHGLPISSINRHCQPVVSGGKIMTARRFFLVGQCWGR